MSKIDQCLSDNCDFDPTSALLMNNIKLSIRDISGNMSEFLISRFAEMKFDGHFSIASFFKEFGYTSSSNEYNLFNSSYQKEILTRVESILFEKGFDCKLMLEERSIMYKARIVNRKRALVVGMLMIPLMFGINYLYDMYVNNQFNGYNM